MSEKVFTSTATDPAIALEDEPRTGEPLHVVRRGSWPMALCGAIVRDEFNPTRTDTAGRERCAKCLSLARGRMIG